MATLRRRFANIFSTSAPSSASSSSSSYPSYSSATAISNPKNTATNEEEQTGGSVAKVEEAATVKRGRKRRNGLVFTLGGIFGVCVALFFANQNKVISLDALMDLNLDSLIDVIPAGIISDAKEFSVCKEESLVHHVVNWMLIRFLSSPLFR